MDETIARLNIAHFRRKLAEDCDVRRHTARAVMTLPMQ
jgi:hypothetical protein